MFNYFNKKHTLTHILYLLRIDYGMNNYPNLTFKYTLTDNILTLELPSKAEYLFSPFESPLTIVYNKTTENIIVTPDDFNVAEDKCLKKHLVKVFKFVEKRDEFTTMVYEDRKRMAHLIDPRHRNGRNGKRNEDGSVERDFVYAASDDSSDDSGHISNDHHSSHHDN